MAFSLRPLALSVLALAAFVAARPAFADYTLPDLQQPQVRLISTGALVDPNSIAITGSAVDTIGVTALHQDHPEITGIGQSVVVIDTGIDYTHPALASNYLTGYDFTTNTPDPMDNWAGGEGHGTHVSGIIASTDATYPGVAPGVKIIALKVFDSTTGIATDANITAALNWTAAHQQQYNITAVNMSLGDGVENTLSTIAPNDPFDSAMHTLKQQGVFVSVASGNDAFLHGQSMPAASKNAVSVGATYVSSDWAGYIVSAPGSVDPYKWPDANGVLQPAFDLDYGPIKDDIAFFTNRYKTATDGATSLMAPGIFITSTVPLALDTTDGKQDGFTDMAGTSMAAPQVTGAAVLVRQALEEAGLLDPDPAKQVDQILKILQETGVQLYDNFYFFGGNNSTIMEVPPGSGNYEIPRGTGEFYSRIDVEAAVDSILGIPEPASLSLLALGAVFFLRGRKSSAVH